MHGLSPHHDTAHPRGTTSGAGTVRKLLTRWFRERAGDLKALAGIFRAWEPFTARAVDEALNAYVAGNGLRFKFVAPSVRTALMGFMGGSHLNEIMAFLGREEALARLERAISLCGADA